MIGAVPAASAAMNAIKASGVLVTVTPKDFQSLLRRQEKPLVVHAEGGVFTRHHKYITSYKGLAFYTKSGERLQLGGTAEVVEAKKITMPDT